MILKSARITSFRSIEDSGEFTIHPVTCLVGENGAGKSAILEALYTLNPLAPEDAAFNLFDYPRRKYADYRSRHATQPATVVTTSWALDRDDRELLLPLIGAAAVETLAIELSKGYDNQLRWKVVIDHAAAVDGVPDEGLQTMIVEVLRERLPKFVYATRYPTLPAEVALDHAGASPSGGSPASNSVFHALLHLAGLDPVGIQHIRDSEELIAELEAASERVNREVFNYWRDGKDRELEFRCDVPRPGDASAAGAGHIFRTRVRDARHGFTLSLDQQGDGFIWFLSFLVWMAHVRRSCGDRLVVLLDHPGVALHAQGQRDLSRYLTESRRPGETVLYTTHSTFLMHDRPSTIRMVEAPETGVRVLAGRVASELRIESQIADVNASLPQRRVTPEHPEPPARLAAGPAASPVQDSPLPSDVFDPPVPPPSTQSASRPEDQKSGTDSRVTPESWGNELAFLRRRDES